MEVHGKEIILPTLESNPFSTLPLESNQSHLLVGRVHLKSALTQYIRFKSPRRILLSGDMGSGRSSLLRCLSNHAPTSVHIDHISHQNPSLGLLREMFFQLTGTEAPTGWSQVVQKLVDASHSYTHSLPLIVIDAQGVELALLSEALSSAGAALDRIQCVLVVVTENRQKTQLPDALLRMFGSEHHLEPFTLDEVQALVETRIKSVSSEPFVLSIEDARHLRDKSFGNPGMIIKMLRNAVDISQNPASLAGIDRILTLPPPPINVEPSEENLDVSPLAAVDVPLAEEVFASIEEAPEQASGDEVEIIDASALWTDRPTMLDQEDDVKILDSLQGFDLNLEQLDEDLSTDAELPEIPFKALPPMPEFKPSIREAGPPQVSGMFSGLVGRVREANSSPTAEVETGTELWMAEGVAPLPELGFKEEPIEEVAAELIHDEVGLFVQEEDDLDFGTEIESFDSAEYPPAPTVPAQDGNVAALTQAVQALITAVSSNSINGGGTSQRAFIDALASLQNKPSSPREEHHINVALLSSLNTNEIAVLAVAKERKFSPSDPELLTTLKVKRSRLSQICNRLLKGGVLNAHTVGRSRYYAMTSTAKAQLVAWGVDGGEA